MSATRTDSLRVENIRLEGEATEEGWQHRAYRFDLYAGSFDEAGFVLSNAPFKSGMANDEVTDDDIIYAILTDISTTRGHEDWLNWAEEFGSLDSAASARKAREDYREIKAREELIAERIGEDALDAAIEAYRDF